MLPADAKSVHVYGPERATLQLKRHCVILGLESKER